MIENTPLTAHNGFDQKILSFQKEKNRIKALIVEYKMLIVEIKSLH